MMQHMFMTSRFPVNSPAETSGTITDYSKLTVTKLKELLDERGVEYDSNALKADLVALLEGAD